ncbi:MAG: energy-coupling factor transporter transmembrane protein EcfT [Rhodospirillales bacterium]
MSLGLYVHRVSPIHAIPPGPKLLVLALTGAAVVATANIGLLAGLLAAVLLLFAVARLSAAEILRPIRPTLWLVAAVVIAHGLLGNWTFGVVAGLRFAILVVLATLISLTTPVAGMLATIEGLMRPLRRLGIRPAKVALVVTLAIRLVPLVFEEAGKVREAQRARGLERSITALFVPLLVRMLRCANEMADAIEARCYDADPAPDAADEADGPPGGAAGFPPAPEAIYARPPRR